MSQSPQPTQRLTVGQAVVRFLAAQQVERDGNVQPFFGGAIGIFGHGNVAGIGQALLQYRKDFRLTRPATSRAWCTWPPATRR